MNDYDTPEIRCSLRNLSRVTEWIRTSDVVYGICRGLPSGTDIQASHRTENRG